MLKTKSKNRTIIENVDEMKSIFRWGEGRKDSGEKEI